MSCPIDASPLQPPLRTEEFETLYHLLKIGTVCQELVSILVYQIDTVPSSVLVHLADQFDLLGYKGWILADSAFEQRGILKRVVYLHERAGTPSGIFAILNALGVVGITIYENPCLILDGQYKLDGSETLSGKRWDRFIIRFNDTVPPERVEAVNGIIDTWKNARSNRFEPVKPLYLDGTWKLDGSETLDGFTDEPADINLYSPCATRIVDDSGEPPITQPRLQMNNNLQLTNDLQLRDDPL